VPVERALDALGARELMRSHHLRIAGRSAGEITIRGGLVSLRGTLVGVSLDLVAVGRALIGVRGGLVPVGGGLIGGGGRLIGVLPSSIPTPADTRFLFSPRATRAAPKK
jgi:hypothetical protein